jgi:hypothetical protein
MYYARQLTLAQAGRLLNESEATASRQLARTRRTLREDVEAHLQAASGLSSGEIARCFQCVSEDAGPLDIDAILGSAGRCKPGEPDRSI